MNTVILCIVIFLIFFMLMVLLAIVTYRDQKIDYSTQPLGERVCSIDGEDYLIVPYLLWQEKKLEEIKKRYSAVYAENNRKFIVNYLHCNLPYEFNDVMFPFLYKEARARLIPQELVQKELHSEFIQNINTNYGQAIQHSSGNITSYNFPTASISEIRELITQLRASIDTLQGIPREIAEDVKDDLDSVIEQIESPMPKKNRIQKALNGIKKFVTDCATKSAVTLVSGTITETDWANFIRKIEAFIQTLN